MSEGPEGVGMQGEIWVTADDARATLVFAGGGRRLEISQEQPVSLKGLIDDLLTYLGLPKLDPPVLGDAGPWGRALNQPVLPSLVLSTDAAGGASSAVQAAFELQPPFEFGGEVDIGGGVKIQLLPHVRVEGVYVDYDQQDGLRLRAKVLFLDQPELTTGDGGGTAQIVRYPFAAPVTKSAGDTAFQLIYFGLGQRFGPTADLTQEDPLKALLDELEANLTASDPKTVLTTLVQKYYHPDRDWYVAAHASMRGFDIRFVFSDPVLYGIEITASDGQLKGLILEILYQKLGPDLGVYYGTLTIPEDYRTINVGAVAITFPSIAIWIYTNGDFRVSVGWPLGDRSIVIQAGQFVGGGGFYFARLRSGDDPGTQGAVVYNPVLAFGIAVKWGVGRSISKGPLSAQMSLTVQGTFQGVLAWRAPDQATGSSASIANPPDNYWFAATVGIVGVLQGSVDLEIIKASISVQITATAGVAFQLGYATIVEVNADVEVSASIKILFVTIHVSFSASFSTSFTLGSGVGVASMTGPQGDLAGFQPPSLAKALAAPPRAHFLELAAAPPAPAITLQFLLHPTVVYDANGNASVAGVAELLIAAPGPDDPPGTTDFETLISNYENWLLATYGPLWSDVATNLGEAWTPGPQNFEDKLNTFLQGFAITLTGVDLTATNPPQVSAAAFPMLPPLLLTAGSTTVAFAAYSQAPNAPATPANYPQAIDQYFQELSLVQLDSGLLRGDLELALTGRAVADYVYTDYFLLLARQLAYEMDSGQAPPPNPAAPLAGIGSRFLVHGLRLPVPSTTLESAAATQVMPLYQLTSQQLAAGSATPFAATLQINPNAASETPGWQIAYPAGGAVAKMPVAATPPGPPAPNWSTLAPVAPLFAAPLWFNARTQIAWTSGTDKSAIVTLPDPLLHLAPASLTASTQPPDANGNVTPVAAAPALLIRLPIERIRQAATGVTPTFVADVYQLRATDEDTRLLLERLLAASDALAPADIQLLYPDANGMTSDPANAPFLAKANLSTTNRPSALLARPLLTGLQALGVDLGPMSAGVATAGDRASFLRLVWECSVTNGLEFYLHYKGLPDDVFSEGDTAEVAFLVRLGPPATPVELPAYANTLVAATTTGLFVQPAGRTQMSPTYPAGCAAFQLTRPQPVPDQTNPYAPATIDSLYTLLQFQVQGAGGFAASGWSQPVGPTADGNLDLYQCVVPVYRFTPAATTYSAVGASPSLELVFGDLFGNQLTSAAHQQQFPVLYTDPLVPLDQWPGLHLSWDVGPGDDGDTRSLILDASFQIADVIGQDQVLFAAPAPGTTVGAAQLVVTGTVLDTTDNVTVQVGTGTPVAAVVDTDDGTWTATVQLASGANTLTAVATAPGGGKVSSTLNVTYTPSTMLGDSGPPTVAVDTFATRAQTALDRYQTIVDQLADAGTTPALYTTLAPPPVAITFPAADAVVVGSTITVLGIVQDPTATVEVNGVAAVVAGDGSYSATVQLAGTLTATATGKAGTSTATVRVWAGDGTAVTAQTQLAGDASALASGDALRGPLTTLLQTILGQLQTVARGGTPPAPPAPQQLSFALPLAPLQQRIDDIFDVGVFVTMTRAANIDAASAGQLPSIASVTAEVPAPNTASFASDFESAFAGFDGGTGTLKIAARPRPAGSPPASTQLSAMRWSPNAGVLVDFRADAEPIYFAPKPLSTKLVGGAVTVPVYDNQLKLSHQQQTYSGVDLDLWATEFLATFESLLGPEMATAIADLAPDTYAGLMGSKATMAEAISGWIAQVYVDQAGQGDMTAAQDQFEQALLASLAADYGTSAIVQRPVWISVAGAAEEGAQLPPRLFGAVTPPPLWVMSPADGATVSTNPVTVKGGVDPSAASVTVNGVDATLAQGTFTASVPLQDGLNTITVVATGADKSVLGQTVVHVTLSSSLAATDAPPPPAQYTFSSSQLPLVASSEAQYLTFLASTAQSLALLDIPLAYHASFLDHQFGVGEQMFGYTPSSWLKFARAGVGSELVFDLGTMSIPLPLRRYPPAPVLIDQSAAAAPASSTGGVAISSPAGGSVVNTPTVVVTGQLPGPGLGVTVQDAPAARVYEADGTYWFESKPIKLKPGPTSITAIARNGSVVVGSSTVDFFAVHGMPLTQALELVLAWNYQVTVNPSQDAHDELVMEVIWNGPLNAKPLLAAGEQTLFEAFACFRSGYAGLAPFVEAAPQLAFKPSTAAVDRQQCITALKDTAQLAADVAAAWTRHGMSLGLGAVAQSSNDYIVQFAHAADGTLIVLGKKVNDAEPPWPTINGESPAAADSEVDGWATKRYPYEQADSLAFEWPALQVLQVQNADANFQTVRNADLGGTGRAVNDAFHLSTPVIHFSAPAVPFVVVNDLGPYPAQTSLADTLSQLFEPVLSLDTAVDRVLRVDVSYAWDVAVGPGGEHVRSRMPLLFVPSLLFPAATSAADPIGDFVTTLAQQIESLLTGRSDPGRTLIVDAVLFGTLNGEETPLLQLGDVEFSFTTS